MALVFGTGRYAGEIPLFAPTHYLTQLRGDTTGDGLRWSDLSALEQAEVVAELTARASGDRISETGRGAIYYVDANTGSNSNAGTHFSVPFLTMAKAFSVKIG